MARDSGDNSHDVSLVPTNMRKQGWRSRRTESIGLTCSLPRANSPMGLRHTDDKALIHPRLRDQIPSRCLFYKLNHTGKPPPPQEEYDHQYFHGSYLHTLWSIAESEPCLPSIHGSGEGHEASTSGVYASDQFETSICHYGWAIDPFGSGLFYRFGWLFRAKPTKCKDGHNRYRGRKWHDIVFPPSEVEILGLLALPDVALEKGTARFYELDLALETVPQGEIPTPRGARGYGLQAPPPPPQASGIGDQLCPAASWCRGVGKSEWSDATSPWIEFIAPFLF